MKQNVTKAESQKIEYKRSWRDEYLGWICGFANAKGGTMYIGIDDDKSVCGVANPDRLMEDLPNKIRTHIGIVADVSLMKRSGKPVIRIVVPPSAFPVNYHGSYHYRTGSTRQVLTGDALTQFLFRKLHVAWDSSETPNLLKARGYTFRRLKLRYEERANKPFRAGLLVSLGLVSRKGILTNAGGLFADDCPVPQSRLFCTVWDGKDKGSDTREDREFHGNVLELLDSAESFIKLNTSRRWIKRARDRIDLRSYPERAVTEALVNAFVHRDYLIFGSEVHVDIFVDHMDITSPGGMPDGSFVQEQNLLRIPSDRRNQVLADVMDQMQYMERKGSGFRKILDAYSNEASNTDGQKPEFYSTEQSFVVSLPNLNYGRRDDGAVSGTVNRCVGKPDGGVNGGVSGGVNGGVNSLLEVIEKNPGLRANAIAQMVHIGLRTVERHLGTLVGNGKVEFRGAPKTGGYYLTER